MVKLSLPEVSLVPDHAPEAEQDVAKDEDQFIIIDSFIEIAVSEAEIDTEGIDTDALPPPPPQETIKKTLKLINIFFNTRFTINN
jgi:hypothetical protein